MPSFLDHALVFLIAVVLPAHDVLLWYPRLRAARGSRLIRLRRAGYWQTIGVEWAFVALVIASWIARSGDWSDLRLSAPAGLGFWTSLALVGAIAAFFSWQRLSLESEPEGREEVTRQLGGMEPILPHTRRELRLFMGVSLTAGICEEVLYRGFILWYLALLVPMGWAVVVSSLLFGMAHAYQGTRGVLQTSAVGLVLGLITLFSGSLWPAMLLHAFIDINSGLLAYAVLRTPAPVPSVKWTSPGDDS